MKICQSPDYPDHCVIVTDICMDYRQVLVFAPGYPKVFYYVWLFHFKLKQKVCRRGYQGFCDNISVSNKIIRKCVTLFINKSAHFCIAALFKKWVNNFMTPILKRLFYFRMKNTKFFHRNTSIGVSDLQHWAFFGRLPIFLHVPTWKNAKLDRLMWNNSNSNTTTGLMSKLPLSVDLGYKIMKPPLFAELRHGTTRLHRPIPRLWPHKQHDGNAWEHGVEEEQALTTWVEKIVGKNSIFYFNSI